MRKSRAHPSRTFARRRQLHARCEMPLFRPPMSSRVSTISAAAKTRASRTSTACCRSCFITARLAPPSGAQVGWCSIARSHEWSTAARWPFPRQRRRDARGLGSQRRPRGRPSSRWRCAAKRKISATIWPGDRIEAHHRLSRAQQRVAPFLRTPRACDARPLNVTSSLTLARWPCYDRIEDATPRVRSDVHRDQIGNGEPRNRRSRPARRQGWQ